MNKINETMNAFDKPCLVCEKKYPVSAGIAINKKYICAACVAKIKEIDEW